MLLRQSFYLFKALPFRAAINYISGTVSLFLFSFFEIDFFGVPGTDCDFIFHLENYFAKFCSEQKLNRNIKI